MFLDFNHLQGERAYSTVHSACIALQNSTVHSADAPTVHILREDNEPHPFLVKSNWEPPVQQ